MEVIRAISNVPGDFPAVGDKLQMQGESLTKTFSTVNIPIIFILTLIYNINIFLFVSFFNKHLTDIHANFICVKRSLHFPLMAALQFFVLTACSLIMIIKSSRSLIYTATIWWHFSLVMGNMAHFFFSPF